MNERYVFSIEKSKKLEAERGISFEECIELISAGHMIEIIAHPNQSAHPQQLLIILNVNGYAYGIPCVEEDGFVRLHTVYPSRKLTRDYLKEKQQ